MQFNSFAFLVFFAVTFLLYCLLSHRWQNRLLLAASYLFYAAWDYRFLSLLLLTTVASYWAGARIAASADRRTRKGWLIASLTLSLALLGFFKYCQFFAESLAALLSAFGLGSFTPALHIALPVGISFYTFQTMSYLIDVYRRTRPPVDSFFDFALYPAFFPLVVAGPIERAGSLLPQIAAERIITPALFKTSAFLILFGLFEKVVVADNLAVLVGSVYDGGGKDGLSVLVATYAFAMQIFADFDGYSNIAKGLAGLMGFHLITNFNAPYFADTPREFWKRWHISLSTWLRDYLYIPLGGNRQGSLLTARNLFLTMLLGGLWHGANWMFLCWGAYHGLLLTLYAALEKPISRLPALGRRLLFFHLICLSWMFFRSQSMTQLLSLWDALLFHFSFSLGADHLLLIKKLLLYAAIPLCYQYLQFRTGEIAPVLRWPVPLRAASYVLLFYMIVLFGFNSAQSFIYSQF